MSELEKTQNDLEQEFKGQKIKAVPKPTTSMTDLASLGIASEIATIGQVSKVDISELNSFTQIAQSRDQLYKALDTMGDDPMVAAILETYAEDATEYNEKGDIVWAVSDDANISKYINFLLQSIQANKHAYEWVYSLCKYGDLYLKTFRQSDIEDDEFFNKANDSLGEDTANKVLNESKATNEDLKINIAKKGDHFVHYVEKVANPATTFELTRFGKTVGYIKADVNTVARNNQNILFNTYNYSFKKTDVNIYDADAFVHALLSESSSRVPEEVSIFRDDTAMEKNDGTKYSVNRGQSLLYNVFKIWRELSLLENSILLNRITKSAIVRLISVEIGDMPKEDVRGYLRGIKELMEQKSTLNTENNMSEYTNPGPIENNVYIPKHGEQGMISTQEIGGDVNVGKMADIDYFTNKYFGCLRHNVKLHFYDGSDVEVEDIYKNLKNYIGKEILSCNIDGTSEIGTLEGIYPTEVKKEFIQFELEDGSIIEVTPEHQMMLKDGSFKQAKELTEDDELMSL